MEIAEWSFLSLDLQLYLKVKEYSYQQLDKKK